MRKRYLLLFVIMTICFIIAFPGSNVNAEENISEIDIVTSPHKVFFDISNSKPGDSFTKVLNVQNNGQKDFKYLFSNRFLSGSDKFYNELVLTVTGSSGELYNGKLNEFEKLNSRNIKSNTSEELTLSIYVPYELGNEYQRLNSEFEFKFYAEGTLGGVLPANGPKLPATGSNMFNILLAGSVLVLGGTILQFFLRRRSRLDRHS
jgi:LPXTG-motif cell wall-anchored protein